LRGDIKRLLDTINNYHLAFITVNPTGCLNILTNSAPEWRIAGDVGMQPKFTSGLSPDTGKQPPPKFMGKEVDTSNAYSKEAVSASLFMAFTPQRT